MHTSSHPSPSSDGLLARIGRVLLDATVIRMMLVPSLLGMLGERAWRLPAWLDRRLPRIDVAH
jgi:uncharacterized membrane protein YdfJ with MMPL/SSD domain